MLNLLFETGCLNVTFWCLLIFSLMFLCGCSTGLYRPLPRLMVATITLASLGMLLLAMYRGYSVPRNSLQDIIAADEYLAGRSMHPDDMTRKMNDALIREGPRLSFLGPWPDLQKKESDRQKEALSSHWVQAHPPFMTLFTAAFVRYFGILGTQAAFFILSLAGLVGMLWLLRHELAFSMSSRLALAVFMLVLGWDPVLTILRSGQIGLVLCGLLTLSWYLLRHDRPIAAGISVALAVSLKLIPAGLLVVLAMRHRRAFVAALAALAIIVAGTFAVTGWADHLNYFRTSKGVVEEYAAFQTNLSLLGILSRGANFFQIDFSIAKFLWMGTGVLAMLGMIVLFRRSPKTGQAKRDALDLEFSLAMTMMPLLSPVAWDHYLTFLLFPLCILAQRLARQPSRTQWIVFLSFSLCLAIPDATFTWLFSVLRSAGHGSLATWLILPFRALIVVTVSVWLIRLIRREEIFLSPPSPPAPNVSDNLASPVVPVRRVLHSADLGAPVS